MWHQPDINNSDIYNQSFALNDYLKNELTHDEKIQNRTFGTFGVDPVTTNMRCFKDYDLEFKYQTDQYSLKYKTECPEKRNVNIEYSDCLGYSCLRDTNSSKNFMYDLDEYNTYHNYLVCKNRDKPDKSSFSNNTSQQMGCCPENIQVFNNWTKRHNAVRQINDGTQELIMEEFKIPILKYYKC
jgi:hypothetical protein